MSHADELAAREEEQRRRNLALDSGEALTGSAAAGSAVSALPRPPSPLSPGRRRTPEDGLAPEAQVRVLRERVRELEEEVKRGAARRARLQKGLKDAAKKLHDSAKDKEAVMSKLREALESASRAEERATRAEERAARAARERGRRTGSSGGAAAPPVPSTHAAPSPSSGSEVAVLRSRLKASEERRAQLLQAVRKQIRLVELLRRQRAHIEAARLLSFTEEDFAKALRLAGTPADDSIV